MLVGHKEKIALLSKLLNKDKLPGTVLFAGSAGIGKKLVAIDLAKKILTEENEQILLSGNHPDFFSSRKRR